MKEFNPHFSFSKKEESDDLSDQIVLKLYGDDDMKKLLLVLVLMAVAFSGCMEKSQNGPDKSVEDLKTLSIKSAENLSSYSLKSSVTQTLLLNAPGANATAENATTVKESVETEASVDLLGFKAKASGSTKNTGKTARPGGELKLYQCQCVPDWKLDLRKG